MNKTNQVKPIIAARKAAERALRARGVLRGNAKLGYVELARAIGLPCYDKRSAARALIAWAAAQ